MEQGPLPPHERTWLHPSELAAMESAQVRSDPGGRSLRMVALMSGTLGLVVVGVLAVMVTPDREASPLAVQTEPSFVEPAGVGPTTSALIELATELSAAIGVSRVDPDRNTVASLMATTSLAPVAPAALATPLESGMAIVTIRSIAGSEEGDEVSVRLASGRTFEAEVVATLGHAAVVAIGALLSDEQAHSVADELPAGDTMVTVMLTTPTSVRLAEIGSIGAPEGTAVVDAAGRLIGLCTEDPDGHTSLVPAVDADEQPPPTSDVADTAPANAIPADATPAATSTVPVAATTSSPGPTSTSVAPSTTARPSSTTTSTSSTTSVAPRPSAGG